MINRRPHSNSKEGAVMNPLETSCTEAYERLCINAPGEAEGVMATNVLLDVREADEWSAGHASNAIHTPLGLLDPVASAATFPAGVTVMCICRSGGRSAKAVEILRAVGVHAINVNGGMNAWATANLPMVADGPSSAAVL